MGMAESARSNPALAAASALRGWLAPTAPYRPPAAALLQGSVRCARSKYPAKVSHPASTSGVVRVRRVK
jgi:hypothetical protein